jgi:PEP-CTERM motif
VFGAGFNPGQEVQPVLGFTFGHANGDGTEKQVHLIGDVRFTVNPGDTFFVQSTLDDFVDSRSQQLAASADASHTLTMQFTEGDTSLLIPAAVPTDASVPEPGVIFLAGAGLISVVLARRTGNLLFENQRRHDCRRGTLFESVRHTVSSCTGYSERLSRGCDPDVSGPRIPSD